MKYPKYYTEPYNLTITMSDIASLPICKKGYCSGDNNKMIKAILFLMGMDVTKDYEQVLMQNEDGELKSIRSALTDDVQTGGYIFMGYERDKYNAKTGYKYLFTDEGIAELMEVVNG